MDYAIYKYVGKSYPQCLFDVYKCSSCNKSVIVINVGDYKYCPKCGVKIKKYEKEYLKEYEVE